MTEAMGSGPAMAGQPVSGWVKGFASFAGCLMVLIGVFGVIVGVSAIFRDDVYVLRGDYLFKWDMTAWGWIHAIIGVVMVLAGFAVFSGQVWARTIGVILAALSGIANFMFLPYYPVWSLLIITLDVVVIAALTMYSKRAAAT
ncbi:DUF7144 family membrane protein [Nonomuraea lactucae]|uniref:DUF7144 family membrane protein n=1 Tax=Nonomuraea lactucae TaxID=2249762 RepID=UPI001964DC81|nr:hypothetical protein [Nonomuraea lactucae]